MTLPLKEYWRLLARYLRTQRRAVACLSVLLACRQRGKTVLAVSHRRAVLAAADQVVVLLDGRVAAAGKLAELLETSAEMRELSAAEAKHER